MIFTDASFVNVDLHSQIGYVICLVDDHSTANIIHWSSTKCKRITRSVLVAELIVRNGEWVRYGSSGQVDHGTNFEYFPAYDTTDRFKVLIRLCSEIGDYVRKTACD